MAEELDLEAYVKQEKDVYTAEKLLIPEEVMI